MQCRLCQSCWHYWKRYGGLKVPTRIGDGDYDGTAACPGGAKRRAGSDVDDDRLSCAAPHRPHRCSVGNCGKEFKLKAHLGRHYATAHGKQHAHIHHLILLLLFFYFAYFINF